MRKMWFVAFVAVALAMPLAAKSSRKFVQVIPTPVLVKPGDTVDVLVVLDIRPDYYVVANYASLPFPTPAQLSLHPPASVSATVVYPASSRLKFVRGDTVEGFSGKTGIHVMVKVPKNAAAGDLKIRGDFRFQVWHGETLYDPAKVPVTIDLSVNADQTSGSRRHR